MNDSETDVTNYCDWTNITPELRARRPEESAMGIIEFFGLRPVQHEVFDPRLRRLLHARDLGAADTANCPFIGVLTGLATRTEFEENGAQHIIPTLHHVVVPLSFPDPADGPVSAELREACW